MATSSTSTTTPTTSTTTPTSTTVMADVQLTDPASQKNATIIQQQIAAYQTQLVSKQKQYNKISLAYVIITILSFIIGLAEGIMSFIPTTPTPESVNNAIQNAIAEGQNITAMGWIDVITPSNAMFDSNVVLVVVLIILAAVIAYLHKLKNDSNAILLTINYNIGTLIPFYNKCVTDGVITEAEMTEFNSMTATLNQDLTVKVNQFKTDENPINDLKEVIDNMTSTLERLKTKL